MWRSLAAAAFIYGCGHPGLEGYRPAALDRPLQAFHHEVNVFARDGKRALATLDDARSMRYLNNYIEFLHARMRGD
jgi:hypothetical protein